MTRNTSKLIIKITPVVVAALLGIIWWANGREHTWLYVSNVFVTLAVCWSAYPKD